MSKTTTKASSSTIPTTIETQVTEIAQIAARPGMTFAERLEELRAVNAQRHYDAALAARTEIEDRMVRQVKARVMEIVDAVTL